METIICPHCHAFSEIQRQRLGTLVRCSRCRATIVAATEIPGSDDEELAMVDEEEELAMVDEEPDSALYPLEDDPRPRRTLVLIGGAFMAVVATVALVTALIHRANDPAIPEAREQQRESGEQHRAEKMNADVRPPERPEWVDASESVKAGSFELTVQDIKVGSVTIHEPLPGGTRIGDPVIGGWVSVPSARIIVIRVEARNISQDRAMYQHPAAGQMRLTDELGNRFLVINEENTQMIQGQTWGEWLDPGQSITDLFLFSPANLRQGKWLFLELGTKQDGRPTTVKIRFNQKDIPR